MASSSRGVMGTHAFQSDALLLCVVTLERELLAGWST